MTKMSKEMEKYFFDLDKQMRNCFEIASLAKKKGFDPEDYVDIIIAKDMAERVEGLISVVAPQIKGKGLVERIKELEEKHGAQDWRVALVISEEVAKEKFCKFKNKIEAMETGIRVGIAYVTNGVVASPLEGFVRLELKKRRDGKEYFCLYFSGPMRSAGGTGEAVSVLIADYIRIKMGYSEYDPIKEEIKRMSTELYDYHERVTNLQYLPSVEEIEFMVEHLGVQISGDPSEKFEVSQHKDLERIETNTIRNGVCLVIGEGLCQKAPKVWKQLDKWGSEMGLKSWKFLEKFLKLQKRIKAKERTGEKSDEKIKPDYTYISDLVAGRPVFTHPLRQGGFRLRYGRCRNSGFSMDAIHPATMIILDGFIAIGTQLKIERPKKGCAVSSCNTIEGPIVRLKNGDVVFVESVDIARKIVNDVEEIIYLGDILINYGDFLNRAHPLVPCGYNEEWWKAETGINKNDVGIDEAIKFCKLGKPLYPRYVFHWKSINKKQLISLIDWVKKSAEKDGKIIMLYDFDVDLEISDLNPKRVLELIGVPHRVVAKEHIVIEGEWWKALKISLGSMKVGSSEDVLELICEMSGLTIKDKNGTFIGARMGRPEKSKMRKLTGSPQVLFPVGVEGGKMRSFQSALEKGKIKAQWPLMYCSKCDKETIYRVCEDCGLKTKQKYYCKQCGVTDNKFCHEGCVSHNIRDLDIHHYFDKCLEMIGSRHYPELIKGIRGTSNEEHIPEHLIKGILRAMHRLYVNKDGTIRYDMSEITLTHFKPKEIRVGFRKLKELGYVKDINGDELVNDEQILEIKPQDIILPSCPETLDEKADDVLLRVGNFVDDELVKLYGMEKFYVFKEEEDLIGHLVLAMSPHTSAAIVGRIIGFSSTQGLLAHPNFHSIMRRDCFDYNTFIPIFNGKNWKNVKIGNFVEKLGKMCVVDKWGTLAKKVNNLYTIGYKNGKLQKVKINDFTKHKPRELFRVKLQNRRSLDVTKEHKFCLIENGEIVKKRLSELSVGDELVIPKEFDFADKNIKFIELSKNLDLKDNLVVRGVKDFVNEIVDNIGRKIKSKGMKIKSDFNFVFPKIKSIESVGVKPSYCLNVDNHIVLANGVLTGQCDGDEAGIMLLMDGLLNFSRKYLSNHRGARQDEPLVVSSMIIPSEVDDMVFDLDIVKSYPLELYEAAMEYKMPWEIKIDKLGDFLNTERQYEGFGFTHNTSDINEGVRCSSYKSIPTMQEKVEKQMAVAEKIRAVDESDVARLVIERHFVRDIKGNLRKFSMQQFRCVNCNEKYRRPPLCGKCKCGGRIIFTIAEGSVVKYLQPSITLAERYNLPAYLKQTLELTKRRIESVFGKDPEKQVGLGKWFN